MTEKLLRKLFPFTISIIEFKAQDKKIQEWSEGIIKEKPDYIWIYEKDNTRYKLGVIEKT